MMNSLFSTFDPKTSVMVTNYLSLLIFFTIPCFLIIFFNNRFQSLMAFMKNNMQQEMEQSILNTNKKGKMNLMLGLFFFILCMNVTGLLPYVFTMTAHLLLTLIAVLPIWMGIILFMLFQNSNQFMAHLVPSGTPLPLSQFMVLIELISQMIRPITLSVRLAANMTAGHILMALSSSPVQIFNLTSTVLFMLIILETAVAIIQSYVFTTLLTMYLSEA